MVSFLILILQGAHIVEKHNQNLDTPVKKEKKRGRKKVEPQANSPSCQEEKDAFDSELAAGDDTGYHDHEQNAQDFQQNRAIGIGIAIAGAIGIGLSFLF